MGGGTKKSNILPYTTCLSEPGTQLMLLKSSINS